MKLIRIGSFLYSLFLFCFIAACVAFPAMAWQKLKERLGLQDARHTRRMVTALQVDWSAWMFWHICKRMRITLENDFADTRRGPDAPVILVSNHTGMFDVLAVEWILAAYGRSDLRWVVKRQMANAPVLGRMAKWSGNAFVARTGDPSDKDAVTACADLAGDDDSSILIFPEGTRNPYELLKPKRGGFQRIREALPDYQVLSVTIAWYPMDNWDMGRTIERGADIFGKHLFLSARIVSTEELADPNWLDAEWVRKKELIRMWRGTLLYQSLTAHVPA